MEPTKCKFNPKENNKNDINDNDDVNNETNIKNEDDKEELDQIINSLNNQNLKDSISLKESVLIELNSEMEDNERSSKISSNENILDSMQKLNYSYSIISDNELDESINIHEIENSELSSSFFESECLDNGNDSNNDSIYYQKISDKESSLNVLPSLGNSYDNQKNINMASNLSTIEQKNINNFINLSNREINKSSLHSKNNSNNNSEKNDNSAKNKEKAFIYPNDDQESSNNTNRLKSPSSRNRIVEANNEKSSQKNTEKQESLSNGNIDIKKSKQNSSKEDKFNSIKIISSNNQNPKCENDSTKRILSLKSFKRESSFSFNHNDKYKSLDEESNESSIKKDSINIPFKGNSMNELTEENKSKSIEYNRIFQRNDELQNNINKSYNESIENESIDSDIPEITNSFKNSNKSNINIKMREEETAKNDDLNTEELNVLHKKINSLNKKSPTLKLNSYIRNYSKSFKNHYANKNLNTTTISNSIESQSSLDFETIKKITQNSDKHHNFIVNQWSKKNAISKENRKSSQIADSVSSNGNHSSISSNQQIYSKLRQSFTTNSLTFNTLNKELKNEKSISSTSSKLINIKSNNSINNNVDHRNNLTGINY